MASNIKVYAYNSAIHVDMPVNTKGQVVVYNVMGQEVLNQHISGSETFNVKAGLNYIVKVISDSGLKTEKVFVK
jgi:hypothetical protein